MRFEVPIDAWSARIGAFGSREAIRGWLEHPVDPGPRIAPEPIPGVSAMALRRASGLGRAAIAIGRELLERVPAGEPLSVITVSELGELGTNDALIESVVAGEAMSPQRFSASVHNHVLGQLCTTLDLPLPGGASTGAASGLEIGMVEALGELAGGRRVLFLAFEPEVDEHYAPWLGGRAPEHMVGVLLAPDAPVRLLLERTGGPPPDPVPGVPHALAWLSLVDGRTTRLPGPDGWRWSHVAA